MLSALASTVQLSGSARYEAMRACQQGEVAQLLETVCGALEEEGRRRLAMKALSGLGTSSADA